MTARYADPAEMAAAIRDGTYHPDRRAQTALARAQPAAWPVRDEAGRTHQKVLRSSEPYEAGDGFYRRRSMKFLRRVKQLALRLLIKSMESRQKTAKGGVQRWGPFSPIDLQILNKMIFTWMDWSTGKLEATYERMREDTGRATDTISASLKRLIGLGLVEKMRRFRREEEGGEVSVIQAPNAYRIMLPQRLLKFVGMDTDPGPPKPDDALVLDREEQIARAMMRADEDPAQSSLEDALGRWGVSVAGRDSS